MSGLEWVVHDDNGGKPPMWLSVFRSWLLNLQDIFDVEWKLGFLHKESWTKNASADGILAWKLAVQTGHVDHPVDLTQLPNNRLVTSDGMINTKAFYVYLTAWAWNDPLAFGVTAANFQPYPREWVHFPEEKDLKIPKSLPIKFVEIPYVLRTSSDIDSSDFESDQGKERKHCHLSIDQCATCFSAFNLIYSCFLYRRTNFVICKRNTINLFPI